jgi:hypothetical protein
MRLAFFDELVAPAEEDAAMPGYVQMGLGVGAADSATEDDDLIEAT